MRDDDNDDGRDDIILFVTQNIECEDGAKEISLKQEKKNHIIRIAKERSLI